MNTAWPKIDMLFPRMEGGSFQSGRGPKQEMEPQTSSMRREGARIMNGPVLVSFILSDRSFTATGSLGTTRWCRCPSLLLGAIDITTLAASPLSYCLAVVTDLRLVNVLGVSTVLIGT